MKSCWKILEDYDSIPDYAKADLQDTDLQKATEIYLTGIGMSQSAVDNLKEKLADN